MCVVFTRESVGKWWKGNARKKEKKEEKKKEKRKIEIPAEQWKEYTVGI